MAFSEILVITRLLWCLDDIVIKSVDDILIYVLFTSDKPVNLYEIFEHKAVKVFDFNKKIFF